MIIIYIYRYRLYSIIHTTSYNIIYAVDGSAFSELLTGQSAWVPPVVALHQAAAAKGSGAAQDAHLMGISWGYDSI